MPITEADIQAFTEFLRNEVSNGGAEASISEIAAKWEADRELRETLDDIRQGEADIEAGRGKPVAEAFADIRKRLGWNQ